MPFQAPTAALDGAKDIVERYRQIASAAISDAETWLRQGALSRAIPEAMPDAIMVTDNTGRIISVNTQFELMFGYHRSEVIGHTPEMLLPDAARVPHVEQRRSYVDYPRQRDMAQAKKVSARRKCGLEFAVSVTLGPIVIPDGIYTIVVIRKVRD